MSTILSFADLVGNALIEAIETTQERKVSYKQLEEYKTNLLCTFATTGVHIIVPTSKQDVKDFFYHYDDYFEAEGSGMHTFIVLRADKEVIDLRRKFRALLPLHILELISTNKFLS